MVMLERSFLICFSFCLFLTPWGDIVMVVVGGVVMSRTGFTDSHPLTHSLTLQLEGETLRLGVKLGLEMGQSTLGEELEAALNGPLKRCQTCDICLRLAGGHLVEALGCSWNEDRQDPGSQRSHLNTPS